MSGMRAVYAANVLVAGVVGGLSLFAPAVAGRTVFSGTAGPSVPMRVVGCLWLSLAFWSAVGLAYPRPLAAVFLVQLAYKGLWLLVVAAPAAAAGRTDGVPWGMAAFFLAWVVVLPFVIPFRDLFGG